MKFYYCYNYINHGNKQCQNIFGLQPSQFVAKSGNLMPDLEEKQFTFHFFIFLINKYLSSISRLFGIYSYAIRPFHPTSCLYVRLIHFSNSG